MANRLLNEKFAESEKSYLRTSEAPGYIAENKRDESIAIRAKCTILADRADLWAFAVDRLCSLTERRSLSVWLYGTLDEFAGSSRDFQTPI